MCVGCARVPEVLWWSCVAEVVWWMWCGGGCVVEDVWWRLCGGDCVVEVVWWRGCVVEVTSHLLSNSLSSSFRSAYRMFHSTETTLLGIHNDLILAMDRGEVTSLILLDLSAAFDTVDHSILLHRLQHWFGLHGTSLDWFSSYLTSRSQAVSIQNSTSSFSNLSCGVPQGSVLGPLLFTLYT